MLYLPLVRVGFARLCPLQHWTQTYLGEIGLKLKRTLERAHGF